MTRSSRSHAIWTLEIRLAVIPSRRWPFVSDFFWFLGLESKPHAGGAFVIDYARRSIIIIRVQGFKVTYYVLLLSSFHC